MSTGRLPAPWGSRVRRDRPPVPFRFEGRAYEGLEGDTLASALLANGVDVLSRSFKYHRPRGVLTARGLDANAYVQVGDEPNVAADRLPLRAGLVATGQNYRGSLERDRDAWIGRMARFLPVGFYYKAFYRPKGTWDYWERYIRRKAGLGRLSRDARHEGHHDKAYLFADVAVVGGGPAGLAAAEAAALAGAEVVLVEDEPELGGALRWGRFTGEDAARERAEALVKGVPALPRLRVMTGATCTGLFADNWLAVVQGERLWKLRAGAVVLATGCVEQPAVFRNNDLPGVMLASAAQRLVRLWGVAPGRRAAVVAASASGYEAALDLLDAGIAVAGVVDLRREPPDEPARAAVRARGVKVRDGWAPVEALPGRAGPRLEGVTFAPPDGGEAHTVGCDALLVAAGVAPLGQLACGVGARFELDEGLASFVVAGMPERVRLAGAVDHRHALADALAQGEAVGAAAARDAGFGEGAAAGAATRPERRSHPWPIFPHPEGKDFVDFDEDQSVGDLLNAIGDGFDDPELAKRYTTVAMGPSQGRHSALNALRIVRRNSPLGAEAIPATTTQRPPFLPESFAHLAGRGFEPTRLTPVHERHVGLGARMMPAGTWLRPAQYGDAADAVAGEVAAVRQGVGLIDVGTLGKLEVRGPDAAEFLERIYTFAYRKQPVGRTRYLLACDMAGAIVDDGVACRLADDWFYVTATTSGVDALYRSMLRWNAEWRLAVDVANVTGAYAAVNLAGPRSRAVLERLGADVDLSAEAFPYLAVREGTLAGAMRARLLRVGFVGELGYEIHVPASWGAALWDALLEAGQAEGIRPFGVEAQRVLRLEKGHLIVGQDTDGLTFPHEAGMAWAVSDRKPFFVGQRAIRVQAARPPGRKLVGFTLPADAPVPPECCLVVRGGEIAGRVTSAARSAACGAVVGLAYAHPDDAEPGSAIAIKLEGGSTVEAKVAPTPFYDPENGRQAL